MLIIVNGEDREIPDDLNLEELVTSLNFPHDRLAIELNGSVIRRGEWQTSKLVPGDRIEIVHFVGGG